MLKLYHGSNSVCSVKVRIVLEEKRIEWESHHVDLPKGEQFSASFLEINPRSFVPVLVDGAFVLRESSVICEYIDHLSDVNPLLPKSIQDQARTRVWGTQCIEYHDSVNTLTFASYQRSMLLEKPQDELEERWKSMPDQIRANKLKDLVKNGGASEYVPIALQRMARLAKEVNNELTHSKWLIGDEYSLADAMLTAYFFRAECLGLEGLWETRYPSTTEWYSRIKNHPSFKLAINPWLSESEMVKIKIAGQQEFLSDSRFSNYV